MKQEQGFSLIEVLIAGGLMIGVVFAVQSLLSNTSKSAGDIEKRMRHRDLVEDLRFAFYDNAQCLTAVRSLSFQNGQEMSLPLGNGTVRAGALLPEYGLKVVHLYLQNVQNLPSDTFTLLLPSRQLIGQYEESRKTADLVLEAELMGSKKALKAQTVQRLTWLTRSGALTEELCFGNHEIPGRNAGGGSGTGGGTGNASPGAAEVPGITLYGERGDGGAQGGAASRQPYCYITDSHTVALIGRDRLIDGESVTYPNDKGGVSSVRCERGRLFVK